jgi:hypothetical protein
MLIRSDILELYIEPPRVPLDTSKIADARFYAEVELVDGRAFNGYVEDHSYMHLDTDFVSIKINTDTGIVTIEGYKV